MGIQNCNHALLWSLHLKDICYFYACVASKAYGFLEKLHVCCLLNYYLDVNAYDIIKKYSFNWGSFFSGRCARTTCTPSDTPLHKSPDVFSKTIHPKKFSSAPELLNLNIFLTPKIPKIQQYKYILWRWPIMHSLLVTLEADILEN